MRHKFQLYQQTNSISLEYYAVAQAGSTDNETMFNLTT